MTVVVVTSMRRMSNHDNNYHLLDILRMNMLPGLAKAHLVDMDQSAHDPIITIIRSHSATRFNNSQIEFIRRENNSFSYVKFDKYMVHLPALFIDQNSETLFLNLVAFETLHFKVRRMSFFLLLMGGLLLMPDNVRLLQDKDIIHSHVIGDAAVIEIIQTVIRRLLFTRDDEFYRLQQQPNDGYMTDKKLWRRKIAKWFSILDDSHWIAIVGVIITIIGLTATVAGAYYTYKSYNLTNLYFNVLQKFVGDWDMLIWPKIKLCLDKAQVSL